MSSYLKSGDVSRDMLLSIIKSLRVSESDGPLRCWIEAPDGWAFDWWETLDTPVRWNSAGVQPRDIVARDAVVRSFAGRVFSPAGELRWRDIVSLAGLPYRCVFLGSQDWVGDALADHSTELDSLESENNRALLWGQQTDVSPGEWVELRIPHRFKYPFNGNPQGICLVTERWLDTCRRPQFIRFCDLQPYQEA